MGTLLRSGAILSALLTVGHICFAQTDPKKVPQPPAAELRKFDPFLGKYEVSGDFANVSWTGTLELKKVIKGWYIEQIILIKTEGIDREFWILATWDKNVQKYRLWGFQTLPIILDNGGEIRFEGDEMITEWVSVRPDGAQVKASNHYRFISKDDLEIVSYSQVGNGPTEKIGSLKGKRMLNVASASAPVATGDASLLGDGSGRRPLCGVTLSLVFQRLCLDNGQSEVIHMPDKRGGLNGSTQHLLETRAKGFQQLRIAREVDTDQTPFWLGSGRAEPHRSVL